MLSRGAREFVRHYSGDRHWSRDVAYRVQQGLPVFDHETPRIDVRGATGLPEARCSGQGRGIQFP